MRKQAPVIIQTQAAAVDPLIAQADIAAQNSDISAIRQNLAFDTNDLVQRYGARVALLGRQPMTGF